MILDAAASLGVDLGRSVMIGDALRDGEAAVAAGVPAACVRIVCGETRVAVGARERGWGACGSFAEAVDSILGPGGGAAAQ
jgi:histidinol phosphatase-like enzyme